MLESYMNYIQSIDTNTLLEEEFEAIRAKLLSLSIKYQKSYWEAEEVVAETYLQAIEKWDQFEGRSKLSTWLYKICVNKNLEILRRKRTATEHLRKIAIGCWANLRGRTEEYSTLREDFKRALSHLDERERSVFILVVFEELSHKEIAEILEVSVSNVKIILHRGRKKLMNLLSNYLDDRGD